MSRARKKNRGNPARLRQAYADSISTAYPIDDRTRAKLAQVDLGKAIYQIGTGHFVGPALRSAAHLVMLVLWSTEDPALEEWRRDFIVRTDGMTEDQMLDEIIAQCTEMVAKGVLPPG